MGANRAFRNYTALVAVTAAAGLALTALDGGWSISDPAAFVVLGLCMLVGELLPVPVPRRGSTEHVTMSPAYAFAMLLVLGPLPAIAVYVLVCVIDDIRARATPVKLVFNASNYALSLLAAHAVLLTTVGGPTSASVSDDLPAVLAAGLAFFVLDNVLTAVGAARLAGGPVAPAVTQDAGFHASISGSLVVLGPVVAVAEEANLWLVPLLSLPMLAIYIGGRAAVAHNHGLLHDELTGLPNRRLLGDELANAIAAARASGEAVCVAAVNLTAFRTINETLGHRQGDALLVEVARRLRARLGPGGTVARLGGDEFALLRLGPADRSVEALAGVVADAFSAPFEVAGLSLELHAVTGLARYPDHGTEVATLMRNADSALHRGRVERAACAVYDPELDDRSVDRLMLAGQLGRAIENGELDVRYQPKLSLDQARPDCVEALVRWRHPELGEIQPDGFIPLAERTGLIRALTTEVLRQALEQCASWRSAGLELRVAVNLSPRNLLDAELPRHVERALAAAGLGPGSLQLEVTESSIVADAPRAREVLERLRATGVSIAIDDFGTGYSSLAQLQSLPVDEIKIDKSFVIGMAADPGNAAIVRSTIDLGRNLGMAVTAEGVETEASAMQLARLGCDYLQGFHVGRPLTAAGCRELLGGRLHARRAALRPEGTKRFLTPVATR